MDMLLSENATSRALSFSQLPTILCVKLRTMCFSQSSLSFLLVLSFSAHVWTVMLVLTLQILYFPLKHANF